MFERILVANRGEIAVRIIATIRKIGKTSVAIYNEADSNAAHVLDSDESFFIGEGTVAETYLNMETILAIVKEQKIDAVHPGYGLLSENSEFAKKLNDMGVAFLGPTPEQIELFGLKHKAREIAVACDLPLLGGTGILENVEEAKKAAAGIGYPVILKSTAGGGGIGMQICYSLEELDKAFESTVSLAVKNFSDGGVFLEKYLAESRHVEVQIFGDGIGDGVILGDRDCSIQRRSQKIIEETPAPNLSPEVRTRLHQSAKRLLTYIKYRSAGTIEFLYDPNAGEFYFLEVNTRLQVEHTVTEEVFSIDIVEWMIRLQEGEWNLPSDLKPKGAAMQFRLYAEDPFKNYLPSTGKVTKFSIPDEARVDSWIREGCEVSSFFDPLLAKIIVKGSTREECISKAVDILCRTKMEGVETNLEFLRTIAQSDRFREAKISTAFLKDFTYDSLALDILRPGTFTSIQDYPGRVGYWQVGVPPSGPMDNLSFRIGNKMLGNSADAAGLEITAAGPKIKFRTTAVFVITGAKIESTLNENPVENYTVVSARPGDILDIGKITDAGQRSYLLFAGGLDVSDYLGSKSTFTLGVFGGHCGRVLRVGDVLRLGKPVSEKIIPSLDYPEIKEDVVINVMYGPHGSPDFFTDEGIAEFLEATWSVHFNSSRTGVRLIGPSPKWARSDGGEAGLHPSNIHDNPYAIGAVDFTGDMPIILGPDGPSLGGFVCPFTIIKSDLWKMGQLSVKSKIRFNVVTYKEAMDLEKVQNNFLERPMKVPFEKFFGISYKNSIGDLSPVITRFETSGTDVVIRQSGNDNILIEIGEPELNLELRLMIHRLFESLEKEENSGLIDLTPGIRSLQIHFDPLKTDRETWIKKVEHRLSEIGSSDDITVPTRIVYLPLSWNDPQARLAMEKYQTTVRHDAPWCPDNIEFIRRINGLDSIDRVYETLFNSNYLVMGLGDVYLGAPVATPLDPRQRLVTTKYNPARTWTPENAVGIGGAYMCIYGMEGPGGYQLCGRTLQMWNTFTKGKYFFADKPYLLRFFDQVKFFPVSPEELLKIRRDFPMGKYDLKIEESVFSLKEYKKFLSDNSEEIKSFKTKQEAAFEAEKNEWIRTGKLNFSQEELSNAPAKTTELEEGLSPITTPVSGILWKSLVQKGDTVTKGQVVAVMESMKMEVEVESDFSGTIEEAFYQVGDEITVGENVYALKEAVIGTAK